MASDPAPKTTRITLSFGLVVMLLSFVFGLVMYNTNRTVLIKEAHEFPYYQALAQGVDWLGHLWCHGTEELLIARANPLPTKQKVQHQKQSVYQMIGKS